METLVNAKASVNGLNKVRTVLLGAQVALVISCLWFQCTSSKCHLQLSCGDGICIENCQYVIKP